MRKSENKRIVWRAAKWCATLLFALFSFLYLYCMQSDLMACYQYILSDGVTSYNPLVGSIVIVSILVGIGEMLAYFWSLPAAFVALSYFPSALILVLLTCAIPSHGSIVYDSASWVWLCVVLSVGCLLVYFLKKNSLLFVQDKYSLTDIWPNILVLFLLFVFVGGVGNTNDVLHDQLKAERLLRNNESQALLNLTKTSKNTEHSFLAIKALAMAENGSLPDKLFAETDVSCNENLLVEPSSFLSCDSLEYRFYDFWKARPGEYAKNNPDFFFEKLSKRKEVDSLYSMRMADYYLCTLLLQRNLEQFAAEVRNFYPINDSLPRYYKEALVLYNRTHMNSLYVYCDNAVEENYLDFIKMQKESSSPKVNQNRLKRTFGNTYWYYYTRNEQNY